MPHVRYDETNKRWYIEKRVPSDIRRLTGAGRCKYHKFPQCVSKREANDLSFGIVKTWEAEWAALRPREMVRVPHPQWVRLSNMTPDLAAQVSEVLRREFPQIGSLTIRGGFGLPTLVEKPVDGSEPIHPDAIGPLAVKPPDARKVFPYPSIIPVWKTYRKQHGKQTTTDDEKDALRKLERLFKFLGHDDMNRVTGPDIDRYVTEDLLVDGSDLGPGGYRDHAIMLRSLFNRAFQKDKIDQNPTIGRLDYKTGTGRRREFADQQYRTIMLAARDCDDPAIGLTMLLMGLSGLRPHELVEAWTYHFRWEEGELKFMITKYGREGDEASLKWDGSERFITVHSAIRNLVWAHIERRRTEEGGKHCRLFKLPRYGGRSGKAATNRIGRWLRKIEGLTVEERQTAYSLRHNVTTAFEEMVQDGYVSESLSEWLTGHATSVRRKHYLHRSVREVARAIEKLPNPFVQTAA